jgi:ubiquinone/menaquinone biosynthesis C-methylase UbiE
MVAREGFQAYGIDFSASAISLAENMLKSYGSSALLSVQNMLSMSFESAYFDGVVDVFSSYCMGAEDGDTFLSEVFRVLKPGGVFFSYFPSKASDAFGDHHPAVLIDADTLSGVYRETSPFAGNHYPFRFMTLEEYQNKLENYGFTIKYSEKVGRTYRNGEEYFEWLTIEARKTPA